MTLDLGGGKERPGTDNSLHITHIANYAQNILLLAPPAPTPDPSTCPVPVGAQSSGVQESRLKWGMATKGARRAFSVLENMMPRGSCSPGDRKRVK